MAPKGSKERKPQSVDLYAGQRIRTRRVMMGLSQEKLAELAGITFQQVQKYERGANRMSVSRLYEFAEYLGAPFQYFVEGFKTSGKRAQALSDNAQEGFSGEDRLNSKETLDLLKVYYSVDDEAKRRELLKLIKGMAKNFQ